MKAITRPGQTPRFDKTDRGEPPLLARILLLYVAVRQQAFDFERVQFNGAITSEGAACLRGLGLVDTVTALGKIAMDTNISRTDTQKKSSLGVQLSGRMLVVVSVFITLMVVVALFVRFSGWEHDRIKLRFENDAAGLARQLEKNINGHLEVLHAIKSFYASSDNVEREEFRTFVTRQLVRHPGIQALEWIPRVSNAERAAYEATAHQDGYPHFQITQRAQQGTW